jgi:hypothetical protein
MRLVLVLFAAAAWQLPGIACAQAVFTRWDFNASGLSLANPAPAIANQGVALALAIGGTTPGPFLADTGSSDPAPAQAWSMSNFPAQGTQSGTAGAEFRTDATGYSNITLELDLRPTSNFSDFVAVQYSLDQGITWTSFSGSPFQLPGATAASAVVWTIGLGGGASGLPLFALPAAANNSPDVRVRLVTVFDPALGNTYSPNSPINGAGITQSYQPTAAIRFDMIEFKGLPAGSVNPGISGTITPGTTCAGASMPALLSIAVAPGAGPASTSISALADTTSVGGSSSIAMQPRGTDAQGRWLFDLSITPLPSTPHGPRAIHVVAQDNLSRTAAATLWLTIEQCCPADLDGDGAHSNGGSPDGGVDINDLLFFLTGFEAGATNVDLDNDGEPTTGQPDGGVDISDLLFFLSRFEIGC